MSLVRVNPIQTFAKTLITKCLNESKRTVSFCCQYSLYNRKNTASELNVHRIRGFPLQQFAKTYATRDYGKIKRPSFKYSGDLTVHEPLETSEVIYHSQGLKDILNDAPETVQRLNSVDFASGQEKKFHRMEKMYDRTEELFGNNCDLEQRIAKLTVSIRVMIPHCIEFPKNKYMKSQLIEKIQMRKKLLKFLRRRDYERFYWLLRELKIRYVQSPEYVTVTRKSRKKMAARKDAVQIRQEKLQELKDKLAAEREEFEKYKAETLAQIEKDIEELELNKDSFENMLQRQSMTKLEAKNFHKKTKS